ncbi:MAG: hypothetical protein RJB66_1870 [Pseudomonadota bacterium]|jgi:hydrogenase maturation protease
MTEKLKNIIRTIQDIRPLPERGRLLIYGIGNIGREDDGLGIRLIEKLESLSLSPYIELESNYQLNVEDAFDISRVDGVIFVDATIESNAQAPFQIREIEAANEIAFSTHAMGMDAVLALCDQLYNRRPLAFVLTLPGYQWSIADQLSPLANDNLEQTFETLSNLLKY